MAKTLLERQTNYLEEKKEQLRLLLFSVKRKLERAQEKEDLKELFVMDAEQQVNICLELLENIERVLNRT